MEARYQSRYHRLKLNKPLRTSCYNMHYGLFKVFHKTYACFTDHVSAAAATVWSDGQGHPHEGEGSAQHSKIILTNIVFV